MAAMAAGITVVMLFLQQSAASQLAVIAGTIGLFSLTECLVPVGNRCSGCLCIATVVLSALTRWHLCRTTGLT
jgi:hypothetical protein